MSTKIPVYFMPGLAASSTIFERIKLSEEQFDTFLLEWEIPLDGETLQAYAKRMIVAISHPNPVLIGVSFGGILVQEMAKFIKARKVIIISSVKSNTEFPSRLKIAKRTSLYKLLPTGLLANVENLAKLSHGTKIGKRLQLYEQFLKMRDKKYLDWALEKIIHWDRTEVDKNIIHIHGDRDDVFPIKNIQNCIVVPGGSHIMILTKYKWFNENLPRIILK